MDDTGEKLKKTGADLSRAALDMAAAEAAAMLREAATRRPDVAAELEGLAQKALLSGAGFSGPVSKIAFVGAVKSGKSTLVNSLIGEDVLPRGSGVLTAQVTEVVHGDASAVRLEWKSLGEVSADFSNWMSALDSPGDWSLPDPEHRDTASSLASHHAASPYCGPLKSLVSGYPEAAERLGERRNVEELSAPGSLSGWATRDDVALFLARLTLSTPSPLLPPSVVLMDCQGSDAWNAAHSSDAEAALIDAFSIVYVISGRVGLRDGDFRLLKTLSSYGLQPVTRFVLNFDMGESLSKETRKRVFGTVIDGLREAGFSQEVVSFSALHGLLERRMLLDPAAVHLAEQRLLEVWNSDDTGFVERSREDFATFQQSLFNDAGAEGQALGVARSRAELRRILVEADGLLRQATGGTTAATAGPVLESAAWKSDTAASLLQWARESMEASTEEIKATLRASFDKAFASDKAPQRKAWRDRLEATNPNSVAALSEASGDPARAARLLKAAADAAALEIVGATEPLRVNGIRNFALEARGALAKGAEATGAEIAEKLVNAGREVEREGAPPTRAQLSREITATRKIPLFKASLKPPTMSEERAKLSLLGKLFGRIQGSKAGDVLVSAEAAAVKKLVMGSVGRDWKEYCRTVLEECLLPHVDDASAQVYSRLASWVVTSVSNVSETRLAEALKKLDSE